MAATERLAMGHLPALLPNSRISDNITRDHKGYCARKLESFLCFAETRPKESLMFQRLAESHTQADGTSGVQHMQKLNRTRAVVSYPKRAFDLLLGLLLLPLLGSLTAAIAIVVRLTSKGPVLYWSDRVGRNNRIFTMPKFRTMKVHTPEVATHLLRDPKAHLTVVGPFLRKTSLDELPQIYSILKGDLSFVGPRPALHNQDDLVALRTELGVHELVPGLTGWAQVNGRDDLPILVKVEYDREYLQKRTFLFDMRIILRTVVQASRGDGVTH
jgi:O-antigen biosynthesis protein WbqP